MPNSREVRAGGKSFFFDVEKNDRGVFVRLTEVIVVIVVIVVVVVIIVIIISLFEYLVSVLISIFQTLVGLKWLKYLVSLDRKFPMRK